MKRRVRDRSRGLVYEVHAATSFIVGSCLFRRGARSAVKINAIECYYLELAVGLVHRGNRWGDHGLDRCPLRAVIEAVAVLEVGVNDHVTFCGLICRRRKASIADRFVCHKYPSERRLQSHLHRELVYCRM